MPSSKQILSERARDRIQWYCSVGFLLSVITGLVFVIILHLKVDKDFDETRCKCVCPHNLKTTDIYNTTVFLEPVSEATECICERVVPLSSEVLCLQCQCTFETRNNLLIRFIIISVVVMIVLMTVYTVVHLLMKIFSGKTLFSSSPSTSGYTVIRNSDINNGSVESEARLTRFQEVFRSRVSRDRSRGYRS